MSVVGVARITCWFTPSSISDGSCSSAALRNVSPGMKSTTNSVRHRIGPSSSSRISLRCGPEPGGRDRRLREPLLVVSVATATRGWPGRRTSHRRRRSWSRGASRPGRGGDASSRRHVGLRLEVAVLEHPRHLDDAPELDLAPAAADVGPVAQRADEVSRLAAELVLSLRELAHLDAQLGVRAGARDLELRSFPSTFCSDSAIGVTRCSTACLRCSSSGRPLLQLLELRLGELQEGLVVRRECVCCERLQR